MSLLAWIVVGIIAGFIASRIMGDGSKSLVSYMFLGIIGAFVGGIFFKLITKATKIMVFDLPSILLAILGACIFIFLARLFTNRR